MSKRANHGHGESVKACIVDVAEVQKALDRVAEQRNSQRPMANFSRLVNAMTAPSAPASGGDWAERAVPKPQAGHGRVYTPEQVMGWDAWVRETPWMQTEQGEFVPVEPQSPMLSPGFMQFLSKEGIV